jgi:HEAT repeat protein
MSRQQLDLFLDGGVRFEPSVPPRAEHRAAEYLDEALIAAIPQARLADSMELAAEAARRRLAAAVPALEALCRRFTGFGGERLVPEQTAALQALGTIGGREAAQAVARVLARGVVQGPTLSIAVSAASQLRSTLPVDVMRALLRHPDPRVRADACRCARPSPELILLMLALLDDLDRSVAKSAACALGQMGRIEALAMLKSMLREQPTADIIDAVSPIADEECVVLLGRIARSMREPADAALTALETIDHPRAVALAAAIRRSPAP